MDGTETNKAIVRRFLGAVASGDIDTIEQLQAPECTWWVVGRGDISRKAYTDDVRGMLLVADPRKVEIVRMVAEGDSVAVEIRSEFHFGERVYANDYHDLFVLAGGRIVHGREYFDTGKVAAFFGPSEGSAMDAERIVREFLALFHTNRLDTGALHRMLADDARYQPLVPIAPVRRGADAIVSELERQYRLYDECACNMLNVAVAGRTVFTERVDTVRQLANGQKTTTHVVGVFELDAQGRIEWWREYWDGLDCAGQLGIDDKTMRAIMCGPSAVTGE
ncbi:MAG: nuclear transport factor 2 family protein [Sphingomonadales bacterium]|nr:nuclear transport factor 2 family protein [Sphingomonadales bacterium]MDE2569465.1 nuclear transport factor 2 family protein [Sphingomonadales bacterium]